MYIFPGVQVHVCTCRGSLGAVHLGLGAGSFAEAECLLVRLGCLVRDYYGCVGNPSPPQHWVKCVSHGTSFPHLCYRSSKDPHVAQQTPYPVRCLPSPSASSFQTMKLAYRVTGPINTFSHVTCCC